MEKKEQLTNEDLLQFAKIINKQFADLENDLKAEKERLTNEIEKVKQSQTPIEKDLPKMDLTDESIKAIVLTVVRKNGQMTRFNLM